MGYLGPVLLLCWLLSVLSICIGILRNLPWLKAFSVFAAGTLLGALAYVAQGSTEACFCCAMLGMAAGVTVYPQTGQRLADAICLAASPLMMGVYCAPNPLMTTATAFFCCIVVFSVNKIACQIKALGMSAFALLGTRLLDLSTALTTVMLAVGVGFAVLPANAPAVQTLLGPMTLRYLLTSTVSFTSSWMLPITLILATVAVLILAYATLSNKARWFYVLRTHGEVMARSGCDSNAILGLLPKGRAFANRYTAMPGIKAVILMIALSVLSYNAPDRTRMLALMPLAILWLIPRYVPGCLKPALAALAVCIIGSFIPRALTLWNAWNVAANEPFGSGYQDIVFHAILRNVSFVGNGLLDQELRHLPQWWDSYMLASMLSTFGWIGLIGLAAIAATAGYVAVMRIRQLLLKPPTYEHLVEQWTSVAVTVLTCLCFFSNVLHVFHVLPVPALMVPFASQNLAMTFWIAATLAAGLLADASRRSNSTRVDRPIISPNQESALAHRRKL